MTAEERVSAAEARNRLRLSPKPSRKAAMKWSLAVAGALAIAGCGFVTYEVSIRSASLARVSGASLELKLSLSRGDLRKILRYQLYPHMILFGCRNGFDFPVDPVLNGVRVDEFREAERYLATHPDFETVELVGEVPADVAAQMDSYCVRIDGGGYFGFRLRSDTVRVAHDRALTAPPTAAPAQAD